MPALDNDDETSALLFNGQPLNKNKNVVGNESELPNEKGASATVCTVEGANALSGGGGVNDDDDVLAKQRDEALQAQEEQRGFWAKYKALFILVPYILLTGVSGSLVRPFIPIIMRDYFGGDKKAALITSYVAAGVAFVGMFTAPFYGKLLDTTGRRLFFIIIPFAQAFIPKLLLLCFPDNALYYIIANAVAGVLQGSFAKAYVADHYSSKIRVLIFSWVQAATYLVALSSLGNKIFSEETCLRLSVSCSAAASLYAIVFINESLPGDVRQPFTVKNLCSTNTFATMKFLLSSKVCRAVVAIVACNNFAQLGTEDIFFFYVNEKVGFGTADAGWLWFEEGFVNPFVMLVILPVLYKLLNSTTPIIFISLAALFVQMVIVALVWAPWVVFAFIVPLIDLSTMLSPILTAIVANSGSPATQGRRLTGFTAVLDLCSAIGPLFFGSVYGNIKGTGFIVTIPFIVGAALIIPAAVVAYHLPRFIAEEEAARDEAAAAAGASSGIIIIQKGINSDDVDVNNDSGVVST